MKNRCLFAVLSTTIVAAFLTGTAFAAKPPTQDFLQSDGQAGHQQYSGMLDEIVAETGYTVELIEAEEGVLVAPEDAEPIPLEERSWNGVQDPALAELATKLMEISDQFSENLAGVAFTSDDSFLEVYAKEVDGTGIVEVIAAAQEADLAEQVIIVPVARSLDDLEVAAIAVEEGTDEAFAASIEFISKGLLHGLVTFEV